MGKRKRQVEIGQCKLCPYVSDESNLVSHMETVHRAKRNKLCPFPDSSSEFSSQVMMTLSMEIKYCCDLCSFNAKSFGELIQHIENDHQHNQIYRCKHCPYISSLFEVTKHYIEKHCSSMFKNCLLCLYTSYSGEIVLQHINDVHKPNRLYYNCLCCIMKFLKLSHLIQHVEFHHGFSFEDCFKLVSIFELYSVNSDDKNSLCQHIQHTSLESLKLNTQDIIFDKGLLRQYFKNKYVLVDGWFSYIAAKNDLMFYCAGSDRKGVFMSESQLNCESCFYFTFDVYSLLQHVKEQHKINYLYQCLNCFNFFIDLKRLSEHLKYSHTSDLLILKCLTCSFYASNIICLYGHVQSKHVPGNLFNCSICAYTTNNATSLADHVKDKHATGNSVLECSVSCNFPPSRDDFIVHANAGPQDLISLEQSSHVNNPKTVSSLQNYNPGTSETRHNYVTYNEFGSNQMLKDANSGTVSTTPHDFNSCKKPADKGVVVNNNSEYLEKISTVYNEKSGNPFLNAPNHPSSAIPVSSYSFNKFKGRLMNTYQCPHCPYKSHIKSALMQHKRDKHKPNVREIKPINIVQENNLCNRVNISDKCNDSNIVNDGAKKDSSCLGAKDGLNVVTDTIKTTILKGVINSQEQTCLNERPELRQEGMNNQKPVKDHQQSLMEGKDTELEIIQVNDSSDSAKSVEDNHSGSNVLSGENSNCHDICQNASNLPIQIADPISTNSDDQQLLMEGKNTELEIIEVNDLSDLAECLEDNSSGPNILSGENSSCHDIGKNASNLPIQISDPISTNYSVLIDTKGIVMPEKIFDVEIKTELEEDFVNETPQ